MFVAVVHRAERQVWPASGTKLRPPRKLIGANAVSPRSSNRVWAAGRRGLWFPGGVAPRAPAPARLRRPRCPLGPQPGSPSLAAVLRASGRASSLLPGPARCGRRGCRDVPSHRSGAAGPAQGARRPGLLPGRRGSAAALAVPWPHRPCPHFDGTRPSSPCVAVTGCLPSPPKDVSHMGPGPTTLHCDLILLTVTTLFPVRSHAEVLSVRTRTYLGGTQFIP